MAHGTWTRFLTLASASVVTLGIGAFLSYQAARQQEAASESRPVEAQYAAPPAPPAQAASIDLTSAQAAGATGATLDPAPDAQQERANSGDDRAAGVSLHAGIYEETRSLFAEADPAASALELRGASPADSPVSASAGVEASVKPAPLDGIGPVPEELALPTLPDKAVPVDGVPVPPRRPTSLAALTLGQPEVAASPAAEPQAARENSFPNIGNALAAVSASVGGADAGLAPQPDTPTVFPEPREGFKKGANVFVRIFKREGALELWMKRGERYSLYKTYPICKMSGRLGPKQAFADYQSPEGFYSVSAKQLNPHSAYHLAFDVGYPNAYDRRHGYTGSKIMVHGDCKSVGCFAMTNAGIDEIYGFVASALAHGQKEVGVHIFPFRMTESAILRENTGGSVLAFLDSGAPRQDWSGFWHNLKEGYDLFESSHLPPTAFACGDRYEFSAGAGTCSRIAGR